MPKDYNEIARVRLDDRNDIVMVKCTGGKIKYYIVAKALRVTKRDTPIKHVDFSEFFKDILGVK